MLRDLVASVKCVLFDFDGPLARLFAGYPAEDVAAVLTQQLIDWGLTDSESPIPDDPLQVLRDAARHGRAAELEELLTQEELKAAKSAVPTPHADRLVHLFVARARQVAVTTNNSPDAAMSYLRGRELAHYFGQHIHGRTEDPDLMKPNPSCLKRAVESTRVAYEDCLMIGDSPQDFFAARRVGITFLGYAHTGRKASKLYAAGASHVVTSLADLCDAVSNQ